MPRSLSTICGYLSTICINSNGNVFSFGSSRRGEHGHEEERILVPTMIPSLTNIMAIGVILYVRNA